MARGYKTGGRQKGTPNKVSALLKDQILEAGAKAHPEGMVGYLTQQANDNPAAYLSLLGKVLPTQVSGDPDGAPITVTINRFTDADDADEA